MTSTLEMMINDALVALSKGVYETAEQILLEVCLSIDLQGPQRSHEMAYVYLLLADAIEPQNRDASALRALGELLRCSN